MKSDRLVNCGWCLENAALAESSSPPQQLNLL